MNAQALRRRYLQKCSIGAAKAELTTLITSPWMAVAAYICI